MQLGISSPGELTFDCAAGCGAVEEISHPLAADHGGGLADRRPAGDRQAADPVPSAKPAAPASAMTMPGRFASLAAKPLPPMIEARPAKAITSAMVRSSVGRSSSAGQAISEAQTGMV